MILRWKVTDGIESLHETRQLACSWIRLFSVRSSVSNKIWNFLLVNFFRFKIILRWKVTESSRTHQETRQLTCPWIAPRFAIRHRWAFPLRVFIFTFVRNYHITVTISVPKTNIIKTPWARVRGARVYFHSKQKGENSLGTKKADKISWNKNQTKLENSLPSNSKYSQTSMFDYPS